MYFSLSQMSSDLQGILERNGIRVAVAKVFVNEIEDTMKVIKVETKGPFCDPNRLY